MLKFETGCPFNPVELRSISQKKAEHKAERSQLPGNAMLAE
jgi:hypothetical protein